MHNQYLDCVCLAGGDPEHAIRILCAGAVHVRKGSTYYQLLKQIVDVPKQS